VEEQLKHAYDEYRKAVQAERSLSEEISGRLPSAEEQEKFERMGADVAAWKAEVDRLEALAKRVKDADEARQGLEALITRKPEVSTPQGDDAELLKLTRDMRVGDFYESAIRSTFIRALATPGGSAVPTTLAEEVVRYEVDGNPMLDPSIVRVISTTSGEQINFPRLTANPTVGATIVAEAGTLTTADPTLSTVALNAYKVAGITLWSQELDQDNVIGLRELLGESLAENIGRGINGLLTTGDGSNKPQGFIGVAANGGTASGTANNPFVGGSDLVDLFYGRKAAYRARGVWQASSTGLAKARKLQDSTGQFLWQPSLAPGQPETILGRPVYENADMAAVASASKSFAFGDFKRFYVRRVTPTRVEVSRDYRFATDELAIKVVERIDGDLIDANAIAYLVSANA
jgi:HK97 family phage major capsid protein